MCLLEDGREGKKSFSSIIRISEIAQRREERSKLINKYLKNEKILMIRVSDSK